jgi:predicted Zn-dependent protease
MLSRPACYSLAVALILPLAACGDSESRSTDQTTTSTSPATVASAPESGATSPAAVEPVASAPLTPVSYIDAEEAYRERRYDDAVGLFDGYNRQHPENPWGYYMLGLSAWKSGDAERAMAGFDEALRLDPGHRKSLFNSARVLLETDRPREALERIERGLGLEPLSGEGYRLLGRARYELGQAAEAIEAYRRAIALDEHDAWAMNNLGLIYIQQGRSDAALPPLARAVELRAESPVFQNNLGSALEQAGHLADAKRAYEAALAADSSYAKAAASLERVTARVEQGDTASVDLAALAGEFQAEMGRLSDSPSTADTTQAQADGGEMARDSAAQ